MKRSINGRKGIMSFNFLMMIPRIIFLVIVFVICIALFSMFINSRFDTGDTQAEIFINGFIYGPGGVSYTDPLTGRFMPTVIDLEQIKKEDLDYAFTYPDDHLLAARIDVFRVPEGRSVQEIMSAFAPEATVYLNAKMYENWLPLAAISRRTGGIGGVQEYEKTLPVILRTEEGELKSGYVKFHIIQPKSARLK